MNQEIINRKYKMRFLGTSHKGKYKYFLDKSDGYVYQENIFGRNVGWICRFISWERSLYRIIERTNNGSEKI